MALNIKGTKYTDKELATIGKFFVQSGVGYKNDPASTTLTAPALHGPFQGNNAQFGIYSSPGVRPERFSTLQRPRSFAKLLRPSKSEFYQEILEFQTGATAVASISNATGFCGNPPGVGQLKGCQITVRFGKFYVKTDLNSVPEIGLLRNRADVPAQILNDGPQENPLIPDVMYRITDTRSQLQYELFRIGVDLERSMEQVNVRGSYTGATQNNFNGWTWEHNGLDSWIKTGYADVTGALCPSLDSAIISFNAAVTGTIGGGDGRNIVQAAHDLYFALRDRAEAVGMEGVEFAFIMRKEQFRAVIEQWACDYATYRCTSSNAGLPFNRDVENTNSLRLEMMNGQYLLIDGIAVPVVFSEGIPNPAIANATYEADIYLVPLSWAGMPLLRLEYFDMGNPYATEFRQFADADDMAILNNGMYIVGVRSTGLCKEYHFAARFRLILETPWLAGRLDNVNYQYRAPTREAIPGTSLYQNGGITYRL